MNVTEVLVNASMTEARAALRPALAEQGCGVLTEIDVAARLNAKPVSGVPLKILGVCDPSLAHQALELDHSVKPTPRMVDALRARPSTPAGRIRELDADSRTTPPKQKVTS